MKYLEKLEGCLCLASSFLHSATGKEVESVMGYCTAVVLHKFYCTDFIGLSKMSMQVKIRLRLMRWR